MEGTRFSPGDLPADLDLRVVQEITSQSKQSLRYGIHNRCLLNPKPCSTINVSDSTRTTSFKKPAKLDFMNTPRPSLGAPQTPARAAHQTPA